MNISQVKTAFKIADVAFVEGSTKLNFNYLKNLKDENGNPLPQSILTRNHTQYRALDTAIVAESLRNPVYLVKSWVIWGSFSGICVWIPRLWKRGIKVNFVESLTWILRWIPR